MPHHFSLQVTRFECIYEQNMEWGKDEMRLFGFGVSRKGQLFATGYRSLGSYGEGDVRPPGTFPMMLFERELPDDGLDVLFYFWLIEEDGSGVRHAANSLEQTFRTKYFEAAAHLNEVGFPRDCIPFTAFYKSVLPVEGDLMEASTDGRNDEVTAPTDLLLRKEASGASILDSTQQISVRRAKHLGTYVITFQYTYRHIEEILIL